MPARIKSYDCNGLPAKRMRGVDAQKQVDHGKGTYQTMSCVCDLLATTIQAEIAKQREATDQISQLAHDRSLSGLALASQVSYIARAYGQLLNGLRQLLLSYEADCEAGARDERVLVLTYAISDPGVLRHYLQADDGRMQYRQAVGQELHNATKRGATAYAGHEQESMFSRAGTSLDDEQWQRMVARYPKVKQQVKKAVAGTTAR